MKSRGYFFLRRQNGEELYANPKYVLPDFQDRVETSIYPGAPIYHGIRVFSDGRKAAIWMELFSPEELAEFPIDTDAQIFLRNERSTIRYKDRNVVPLPTPEMPDPPAPITAPVVAKPASILDDPLAKGHPILEAILRRRKRP
jgi:hypothetical protein